MPEMRVALEDMRLGPIEDLQLKGNLASTLMKLVYAFLWQEEVFGPPFLFEPEANIKGAELIPKVNAFANRLNTYTFYEQNFQDAISIFPGDYRCNREQPHTKWHTESAVGLLDLLYMCDFIHSLTINI
jgi:hypothetical protein